MTRKVNAFVTLNTSTCGARGCAATLRCHGISYEYSIPYALLGRIAHALFVERWLKAIFDYRAAMISRFLEAEDKEEERTERNRAITG
jgi:hypothetical protein